MLPLNLYARVRFCLRIWHARPRVQRAPGLPCALYFLRANVIANLGRNVSREREVVSSVGWVERSDTHQCRGAGRGAKRPLEGIAHRRSDAPQGPWNPALGTPATARLASISGSLIPLW